MSSGIHWCPMLAASDGARFWCWRHPEHGRERERGRGDNVELVVYACCSTGVSASRGKSNSTTTQRRWPLNCPDEVVPGRERRRALGDVDQINSMWSCFWSWCARSCPLSLTLSAPALPAKLGYLRSILCCAASASATNCFSSGSCLIIRQNNLLQVNFSLTVSHSGTAGWLSLNDRQCDRQLSVQKTSKQQLQLSHTLCKLCAKKTKNHFLKVMLQINYKTRRRKLWRTRGEGEPAKGEIDSEEDGDRKGGKVRKSRWSAKANSKAVLERFQSSLKECVCVGCVCGGYVCVCVVCVSWCGEKNET